MMSLPMLDEIRSQIENTRQQAGIETNVTLVGASKKVEAARLQTFFEAGLNDFGENYIQEGLEKIRFFEERGLKATWHFIGALQSNKAREAVAHFDWIHSVDRLSLAKELNKEAGKIGKIQRVLIQVNVGGEISKAGVEPEKLPGLLKEVSKLENLSVQGLMSLPPFREDSEQTRPFHKALHDLLLQSEIHGGELSMGMSHDFPVAIEEGATLVRIGTALFGVRS